MKKDKNIKGNSIAILIFCPITALYFGLVLSSLWGWFIVPAFGFPSLSIAYGTGIGLIKNLFTIKFDASNKDEELIDTKKVVLQYLGILTAYSLIYLTGFIVFHLFG